MSKLHNVSLYPAFLINYFWIWNNMVLKLSCQPPWERGGPDTCSFDTVTEASSSQNISLMLSALLSSKHKRPFY